MTEAQTMALLVFARNGSAKIGTRRIPVPTFAVLERLGLVEPASESRSYYNAPWKLTAAGEAKVKELIR